MTKRDSAMASMRKELMLLVPIALGFGVMLAVISWVSNTHAMPALEGAIMTGWARVEFMIALPLRLLAIAVTPGFYMYTAYPEATIIALVSPLLWMLLAWAAWRWWRSRRQKSANIDWGRRDFLVHAAVGTGSAGGALLGGHALLAAPQRLELREYTCAVRDLPASLDGLRIAHVSDTHRGPFVSAHTVERALQQANALEPDLVVLTGDYIYRHASFIKEGIGMLGMLRPRIGSVAVLGNHDNWQGPDACREAFAQAGIPVIEETRLYLDESGLSTGVPRREALCLAGLGDLWTDRTDFDAALGGVPEHMPRLVLAHNPDTAELIPRGVRVDLMISGHTHGGQVSLPLLGTPMTASTHGERFLGGLCHGSHCPVIVSRGVGVAGIPVRFRVPPEIGLITLTRAYAVLEDAGLRPTGGGR